MTSQLWLPALSPLFFYSPSPIYFAGSAYSSNWTTVNDGTGASGNDSVATARGPAAVLLPVIYSTAFTPIWDTVADYAVQLVVGTGSSETWSSGESTNETGFASQTYELDIQCSGSCAQDFVFRGAYVETYYLPQGSLGESMSLDDASSGVQYAGFSAAQAQAVIPVDSSIDFEGTLSETQTAGATANVTFQAASIMLIGAVGPALGDFDIYLDSTLVGSLSAAADVVAHGVPLYFGTNLDTSKKHTLGIESTGSGLVIDAFTIWGPSGGVGFYGPGGTPVSGTPGAAYPPGSGGSSSIGGGSTGTNDTGTSSGLSGATSSGGVNAGAIVGGVLAAVAAIAGIWWFFNKRAALMAKAAPEKLSGYDDANHIQKVIEGKNQGVHITTFAHQRYYYPGGISYSKLKK